ncbi:FAD-dependent oxidoreductase [Anaerovorax odorimutans]|uniref:FAD-dependent oxidoreductase n=1 Tax=Anaerovorax odorimutans TaxID=109327 RepID=UPI00041AE53A|nr:FAD-dependent oxidoreductase [Anaerovorax odorimutans]
MKTKQIAKDLYWVGNLDPELKVFDIIMYTEFGTSYNSYLLKGSEKTTLFETSKAKCFDEYLEKVKEIVDLNEIEYIIVDHTEPDHTGSIEMLLELNPKLKVVGSAAAINFMKEICNKDFNSIIVKDGDKLSLGNKTLRFISAPNLHWPDTMYTYIEEDGVLITCDSFGAHYSSEGITNDKIENQQDYMKALRYYFDNIIGPFKSFSLEAIEKIKDLDIKIICTGHGPVLTENPRKIVDIYKEWSTETNPNEKKTVVIPYVTAYGYTGMLAEKIAEGIKASGDIEVRLYDLVTDDVHKALEDLYWADGILFGTPTIVGEALKPIWDMTTSIFAKTHGGKIASAFGSYGWSGEGVPNIMQRLKQLRMKLYGEGLRIKFKPNEAQLQEAFEFGYGFGVSVLAGKIVENAKPSKANKMWKCLVCGEIVPGEEPPQACPVCGVGPEQFVEVEISDIEYSSEREENFIIVGNGAAGTTAAEEIRKRNLKCSIEIISDENVIGYNRPMLTKGILTDIDEMNFYIKPAEWYEENNIKVTLNTKVTSIDDKNKNIILLNKETRKYDKLILATGAKSFIPPIKGSDKKGVYAIRTLNDINVIHKELDKVDSVAVIGGGILGLEAAWQFKKSGKDVTVIEKSQGLMVKQLDDKASALLRDAAEKVGINVLTGAGIEEITGTDKATGVKLSNGVIADGQIVVLSTGVRQNTDLAKEIGAEVERSIVVNEKMETSVADIYACGDCAQYDGANFAIWSQAIEMGKVAGINAVGDESNYETVIPSNAFQGMNIQLFALGDNGRDPDKKYKSFEIFDDAKHTYEKLYFVNNRFCGGILLGDVSKSAKLLESFENKDPMIKLMDKLK